MKRPKYGNRKVEAHGLKFDSAKEARRYGDLLLLQRAGEIANLQHHVRFPFVFNGIKVCTYIADFTYDEAGKQIVEDVKSEITRKATVYRIKNKLMRAVYGIEIRET